VERTNELATLRTADVPPHRRASTHVGAGPSATSRRDDVVIATKIHGPMRAGPNSGGLSRKVIMTEIDASLRRPGTDYVDLYQIHRRDRGTPIEETLECLHDPRPFPVPGPEPFAVYRNHA
jgi:aryl-alcohol dehydrogenase (NADP+)